MKKNSFILALIVMVFCFSCQKDSFELYEDNAIPDRFSVEIPQSLKKATENSLKNNSGEVLKGTDIYKHLATFIYVGDNAAKIIEGVIIDIRQLGLSQPMSFSYQEKDDNRVKDVQIIENAEFEGSVWDYQMTIVDADSKSNEDGGIALQVFWNVGIVEGLAIMKPYNINRDGEPLFTSATFRVDYSEANESGYDQQMTVYISGLTLPVAFVNRFAMETMKMTVRKKGDLVELFGNSNHPNAYWFSSETGFNWAFVAAGQLGSGIGIAEVGLPPSNLKSTDRAVILGTYSLKNVFTNEISSVWPFIDQALLALHLQDADAPGYFGTSGFIAGGSSPGSSYNTLETAIEDLVPYNPYEVTNLSLTFKTIDSEK